jgi:hypothetical protein
MKIITVNINDLIIEGSRFDYGDFIFSRTGDRILERSVEESGILNPVIVYEDRNSRYHLVDGWKRVEIALEKDTKNVEAAVLPDTTALTDIISLIYCDKIGEINESVINKIEFIYFALYLDADKEWIVKHLCTPFGLKPHSSFLEECRRIHHLPQELKFFCHEKRLSLKQIANLSYYPDEIITQVLKWKSLIHLTASIMDEIAVNLRDYLKASGKGLKDFLCEAEVKEVFDDSLNIRERTERLRNLLRQKKFPILTEVNSRIQGNIDSLNLPEEIIMDWDRTLENKRLDITLNLKDPAQWPDMVSKLKSDSINEAINKILDEL